jgi:protoporphyrinogen oxidase
MDLEWGKDRFGAEQPRVVVVGAGFSGLAAAYELAQRGLRPIVLEAAAEVGGLAATFEVAGARLERFYHHWFTNDRHVVELVRQLGLQDRIVYKATRTGMYFANQIYRLSTPLDVLRFPALPLSDRIRLGLTVLRARRVRDWREIDHLSAAEWLRHLGGDRAFRVIWEPLLRGKFGPHADEVSAAWFWSKLRLRGGSRGARGEEQLAYFRGGFAGLADELVKGIRQNGGQVRLKTSACGLITENGRVTGVANETESIPADAVILTPALPIIAGLMKPHVSAAYADRLAVIDYLANVCVVLEMTKSLSELYWMNINDPEFPFVGIIEHTNLDQADPSGRRHVVYFSRYLPASDCMFDAPDDHVVRLTLPHIQRMFPNFDPGCIRAAHVWRARYAQPLVIRNYGRLIPAHQTPLGGVFIASMAQVYPEDRGTNYAIRDGRAVARLAANSLSAPA